MADATTETAERVIRDFPDLYAVLGVAKTAKPNEIKKAYHHLALRLHPDKNPDNKKALEAFKLASRAQEILLDEKKRELYDEEGFKGVNEAESNGERPTFSQIVVAVLAVAFSFYVRMALGTIVDFAVRESNDHDEGEGNAESHFEQGTIKNAVACSKRLLRYFGTCLIGIVTLVALLLMDRSTRGQTVSLSPSEADGFTVPLVVTPVLREATAPGGQLEYHVCRVSREGFSSDLSIEAAVGSRLGFTSGHHVRQVLSAQRFAAPARATTFPPAAMRRASNSSSFVVFGSQGFWNRRLPTTVAASLCVPSGATAPSGAGTPTTFSLDGLISGGELYQEIKHLQRQAATSQRRWLHAASIQRA